MNNSENKKKRPTPTERKQIHCKFTHEAFAWIEENHWELRSSSSYFVNKCVEFAQLNEAEFLAFFNESKDK